MKIKPALDNKPQITLSNAEHNQTPVVQIDFAYDKQITNKIRNITNAKWSATMKCFSKYHLTF